MHVLLRCRRYTRAYYTYTRVSYAIAAVMLDRIRYDIYIYIIHYIRLGLFFPFVYKYIHTPTRYRCHSFHRLDFLEHVLYIIYYCYSRQFTKAQYKILDSKRRSHQKKENSMVFSE